MSKINDYFISFYGNVEDITGDLVSVSEINPRLIYTNGVLLTVISSSLSIQEINEWFYKENRFYVIQKIGPDTIINLGEELTSHLLNKDENYIIKKKVNLNDNSIIKVEKIDEETKNELINDLLIKVKNNTITDNEKEVLRKLVNDEE